MSLKSENNKNLLAIFLTKPVKNNSALWGSCQQSNKNQALSLFFFGIPIAYLKNAMRKQLLFSFLFWVFSLGINSSLFAEENSSVIVSTLQSMCEKIAVYEKECGSRPPQECKSYNPETIENFVGLCFYNSTLSSSACIKQINWLYADLFSKNHVEPCKTSLNTASAQNQNLE